MVNYNHIKIRLILYKLIEGGHFDREGRYYAMYLTHPEYSSVKIDQLSGGVLSKREISFSTKFYWTTSKEYVNIGIRIFGFGFGFEIAIRSNNGK